MVRSPPRRPQAATNAPRRWNRDLNFGIITLLGYSGYLGLNINNPNIWGYDFLNNWESDFVKIYVKKFYQDRLLFELSSQEHREKAISRFSHNAYSLLNERLITHQGLNHIRNCIHEVGNDNEKCHIISWDKKDGKCLSFHNAFEHCVNSYTVVILICEHFAVVKEEVTQGAPNMYILQT